MFGVRLYVLFVLIGICWANYTEKDGQAEVAEAFFRPPAPLGFEKFMGKVKLLEDYDEHIRIKRQDPTEAPAAGAEGAPAAPGGAAAPGDAAKVAEGSTTVASTTATATTKSDARRSCSPSHILLFVNCLVVAFNSLH